MTLNSKGKCSESVLLNFYFSTATIPTVKLKKIFYLYFKLYFSQGDVIVVKDDLAELVLSNFNLECYRVKNFVVG